VTILVVDAGTSSVRAALVTHDARVVGEQVRATLPASPADGLVEIDADALADAAVEVATAVLRDSTDPVEGIGISCQRASTIVWDRATGTAVGPGLGWQDLRTVGRCLELRAAGVRVAPNVSATKAEWLLDQVDAARTRDLCVGTVDAWLVWRLTEGRAHVSDATNAAVTGLVDADAAGWDPGLLATFRIPPGALPRIVDSAGAIGPATALPGAPPIVALVGDQQASLVGQGGVRRGDAKITFGTGGMLDLAVGEQRPAFATRGAHGTFPIVAWRHAGRTGWGVEAAMLAAGTNVEWLRDGLGIVASAAETADVAASCSDTGGVVYVPALLGLGTPQWDFGARGTFVGITRGTGRAQMVRAVLEGVAHSAADLVEAAEADAAGAVGGLAALRVDGGMSENPVFVQALADATGRPVEISPVREATALGAGLLGLLAVGRFDSVESLAATWRPRAVVEPDGGADRIASRQRWRDALERAARWIEPLSAVDF
jgi:glycerol kinase